VPSLPDTLRPRRIALFCLVAFGFSWLVAGYVYATGGLDRTGGAPGASSLTALLVVYMFGPAVGHLVVRLATDAPLTVDDAWLRPHLRARLRWYALAWFLPAILTLLGVGLYYALFPGQFDPTMEAIRTGLGPAAADVSPALLAAGQLAAALSLGPAINTVVAFGEEFGWRGFLLQHLAPLGRRPAVLLTGVAWGVWHWPIVAMGYNYGLGYPGAPWPGMLAMVWVTVLLGTVLAWVTFGAESVWPAAVGHGAFNAIAGFGVLFAAGEPNPLLGPMATGIVVSVPTLALAAWLLREPSAVAPRVPAADLE